MFKNDIYEEAKVYKEAFHLMMEYWHFIPVDEAHHVDEALLRVGI